MFLITMMISIDSLKAKLILVVIFSIDCRFLHGIGNKLSIWLHTHVRHEVPGAVVWPCLFVLLNAQRY